MLPVTVMESSTDDATTTLSPLTNSVLPDTVTGTELKDIIELFRNTSLKPLEALPKF